MQDIKVEEVVAQMKVIREQQGEEAFISARDTLVKMLVNAPRGEAFLKLVFPDLDLEPYKILATNNDSIMIEALKAKTPHLKTKIQLDLLVAGADAYMLAMDCLFAGKKADAVKAMDAVALIWQKTEEVQAIAEQVAEIPLEERSVAASAFVEPPVNEQQVFTNIMADLTLITTKEGLEAWYTRHRAYMDKVVTQGLRNKMFDAIRELKHSLSN